jgi:hypothetical protein
MNAMNAMNAMQHGPVQKDGPVLCVLPWRPDLPTQLSRLPINPRESVFWSASQHIAMKVRPVSRISLRR